MDEANTFATHFFALLVGMLMSFGIVLVFIFLGSNDTICRSALYGFVSTIL